MILLAMVTLDGYFDGPGEGLEKIDWHHADEEWEDYSVEILSGADTLLFGRKTYEGFAAFWPTQEGELARLLNEIEKIDLLSPDAKCYFDWATHKERFVDSIRRLGTAHCPHSAASSAACWKRMSASSQKLSRYMRAALKPG